MIEKLGQLIITGIEGTELNSEEAEFLKNNDIGGVILFSQNYQDPGQLAELVNSIQALRGDDPLFIGVDQEGGRVQRFKTGFSHFPAMMEVAKLDSPKLVFELHEALGRELLACGVNLCFSPVCDVLTNPNNKVIGDRAFGTDVEVVEKFVSAAVRGLQTAGVISCAKHFPGHGSSTKDSHFDLPIIKTKYEDLQKIEYPPFIKAAKSRVEMVMMAHLIVDSLDQDLPTSLSSIAYKELREKIRFNKVIITDDLEMKAIADHFGLEDAAEKALNAGADILLYRYTKDAKIVLSHLQEKIKTKVISKKEIEEKLARISELKKTAFEHYKPIYIPSIPEQMKKANGQKILKEIQELLSKIPQE